MFSKPSSQAFQCDGIGNSVEFDIGRTAEHPSTGLLLIARTWKALSEATLAWMIQDYSRQSVNLGGSVQTEHSTRLLGREAVAVTERTCFNKSITWRNYTFGMRSSCTPGYQIWSAADCTSRLLYRVCCSSLDACSLELYSLEWVLRPPLDNVGF